MGTPFDRVEDLATRKVHDWKLGKIYNRSLEGYNAWCDGFLLNAIPNFANDCWQSLEYDEETRKFVSDLTPTKIDILACFWVLEWWERETNDSAQNAAKMQTSSFSTHSPAQHMKEEQVIINTKRESAYQKINDYLLQDLDKIGSLIMDRIDEIFNVLIQYEKAIDDNDVTATIDSYLSYVDKLYVRYFGQNHSDISAYLKGLYLLGADAHHDTVKQVVFDIIHILEKE